MIPPIMTGSNSFFQRKGSNNGFQRVTTGKFIEMQVRAGDQAAYPHHMPAGFVSRGADMGASAPCK